MLSSERFIFDPRTLDRSRPPGISAFMRIKNGEDFLEAAIESHIEFFDEIVAVHNGCTDASVVILERLVRKYPEKLRVLEYEPEVPALGSAEQRCAGTFSVHSMANYSNYGLMNTRYSVVTKLDDDHVAIPGSVGKITSFIRDSACHLGKRMVCFSGINLAANRREIGIHRTVPFAGHGDHWFLEAGSRCFFRQDRRFERLHRYGMRMEYHGIAYWHMKFLKRGNGFSNYQLERNPDSRFHKQWRRFEEGRDPMSLPDLEARCRLEVRQGGFMRAIQRLLSAKERLRHERMARFNAAELQPEFQRLMKRLLAGGLRSSALPCNRSSCNA